jgi:hypothetical protein
MEPEQPAKPMHTMPQQENLERKKKMKVCPTCSNSFVDGSKNDSQIFCNKKCLNISKRVKLRVFTCQHCNNEFESMRQKKFCSLKCCEKSTLKYSKTGKKCEVCDNLFKVDKINKYYCSNECKDIARKKQNKIRITSDKYKEYQKKYRQANKERLEELERQRQEREKHKNYTNKINQYLNGANGPSVRIYIKEDLLTGELFVTKNNQKKFKTLANAKAWIGTNVVSISNKRAIDKTCKHCNKQYTGKRTTHYCSKSCKKEHTKESVKIYRYNARQKRRTIEKKGDRIIKDLVYERFGYICCHCGVNTFNVIRGIQHPHEPTIDHVIPLAKGGTHTYHNVQLLCRSCNSRKRDTMEKTMVGDIKLRLS